MEYAWEKPLCFIENSDDHGLRVNEETFAEFNKINVPVSVVAIVGLYRTGKSYLLNLLGGSQRGFSLGSTIQAETKGIWAWCRPHPTNSAQCLLLLDTEGLGDVAKGDKNHDTWIFALAVLLSSTLIYNSIGKIDQGALEDLHFVTKISENIEVKAGQEADGTEFDAFFPNFIWAIRDFILELEMDGKSMTSDEYLERALQLKPGCSVKISEYNRQRMCIKTFFPSRKCFTFPQPVKDRNMMKDLDHLDKSNLDPDFIEMSQRFMEHVIQQIEPKTIEGRTVTGRVLANLAKYYVDAIQRGAIPCIQSAVETTAKLENEKAKKESVAQYRSLMQEKIKLPTESLDQLSLVHRECERVAIETFLRLAIFDSDLTYQKQMKERIEEEYGEICKQNEKASAEQCSQILQKLYSSISAKNQAGDFTKPGGYEIYKTEMLKLENFYHSTPGKGIKAKDVLNQFMKEKEVEASSILAADQRLDEEQKKVEDEKRKVAEYKRRNEAVEEENRKKKQQLADTEKSYEEHVKQLKENMVKQKADLLKEQEAQMSKILKEKDDLLQKGFQQQAEVLQKQVEKLQEKLEKQKTEGMVVGILGKVLDNVVPIVKLVASLKSPSTSKE